MGGPASSTAAETYMQAHEQTAIPTALHSFFYKHTGKLGWSSICLRFSQFEPEIMLDGMLNFKTHFMVWYCSLIWTLSTVSLTFEILWVA